MSLLSPVGQLVVISAKHGQSPIDSARYLGIATKPGDPVTTSPATILLQLLPFPESPANANGIGPTEDDISLIWLGDSSQTKNAVGMLEAQSPATNNIAGIGQIFSGPGIGQMFNLPGLPPRRIPMSARRQLIGADASGFVTVSGTSRGWRGARVVRNFSVPNLGGDTRGPPRTSWCASAR